MNDSRKESYYARRKAINLETMINAKLVLPERQTCDWCGINPDMVSIARQQEKTTLPVVRINRITRGDDGRYYQYMRYERLGFSYSMAEFNRRLDSAEWMCLECRRQLNREARLNATPVETSEPDMFPE